MKNGKIELLRFLFALVIVAYHCVTYDTHLNIILCFKNGYVGVEFFLILSGFFFAKSFLRLQNLPLAISCKESVVLTGKRVLRILPCHIVACLLMALAIFYTDGSAKLATRLWEGIPSIFLVQMAVVFLPQTNDLIKPEWYLSAMFIVMLLVAPTYLLFKKTFRKQWAALLFTLLLGPALFALFFAIDKGNHIYWNLLQDIRAWGEISLGLISHSIASHFAQKIKGRSLLLPFFIFLTMAAAFIFAILPAQTFGNAYGLCYAATMTCLFIAVTLLGIDTLSTPSSPTNQKIIFQSGFIMALGKASLPLYLFHASAIKLLQNFDFNNKTRLLLIYAISLFFTAVFLAADFFVKKHGNIFEVIRTKKA